MIESVVHTIGSLIEGTPLEEPVDRAYYRVTGPRRTAATAGGITAEFNARSSSEYYSSQNLGGEGEIIEAMLNELSSNDLLWDIGSFVGWHAALFGQVAETVAFEADPNTFRKLQETCTLNPKARITPVCLGLGNPPNGRELVSIIAGEGGAVRNYGGSGEATMVASPSSIINTVFKPPTAVKVDVQGLEGEVIDGFGEYLADIRVLFVEFHNGRITGDWTSDSLHEHIIANGFEQQKEIERRKDTLTLYIRP